MSTLLGHTLTHDNLIRWLIAGSAFAWFLLDFALEAAGKESQNKQLTNKG